MGNTWGGTWGDKYIHTGSIFYVDETTNLVAQQRAYAEAQAQYNRMVTATQYTTSDKQYLVEPKQLTFKDRLADEIKQWCGGVLSNY